MSALKGPLGAGTKIPHSLQKRRSVLQDETSAAPLFHLGSLSSGWPLPEQSLSDRPYLPAPPPPVISSRQPVPALLPVPVPCREQPRLGLSQVRL